MKDLLFEPHFKKVQVGDLRLNLLGDLYIVVNIKPNELYGDGRNNLVTIFFPHAQKWSCFHQHRVKNCRLLSRITDDYSLCG